MNTLQIEDITTGTGTRLHRAVDAAAALAACGFTLRYKKLENTASAKVESAWFVDTSVSEAHNLLLRAAIGSGPESLLTRAPEHPFLAGLFAIRSLRVLMAWPQSPQSTPSAIKPSPIGRLLFLQSSRVPHDLMPIAWVTEKPAHDVALTVPSSLAFCAAAIVCGFLPHPRLTGPDVPHVHFPNASLTFPGLTLPHFHARELPDVPAGGRHPFSFALSASLHWQSFTTREETERRKTFLLRSRFTQRTAMISSEIMDESNGEAAQAREEIEEHLALV